MRSIGRLGSLASLAAVSSLAACGGGNSGGTPDAPVVIPDAPPPPPDAPMIDAPPTPTYDFSCLGQPFPTTAPATVTAAGTVQELTMQGLVAVDAATVATFKLGTPAAVDTATSAADGAFQTGALATGGVPFDGYLHGFKDDGASPFRHTFVFPPAPLAADAPIVPILTLRSATFGAIATFFAMVNQNDAANGALMLIVTDCANMPVTDATLSVKQGGASVGTVYSLAAISPMAAGIYFVYNVPAGDVDVSATRMTTTFPSHRVVSFKNGAGITTGATTLTIVRPGPL
jgi:hypothetical protein